MHIDSSTIRSNGKTYTRHLLRTSFREDGKVKHKTIANLSHYSDAEIEAVRLILKNKDRLPELGLAGDVKVKDEKRFGAVWCLYQIAERLKLCATLGDDINGKLALWQVFARLIGQGSRLSAVRLAQSHLGCELLGIDRLDEDDLYKNLAWLAQHQEQIELGLFRRRYAEQLPSLFLYDVTSSYLEGDHNARRCLKPASSPSDQRSWPVWTRRSPTCRCLGPRKFTVHTQAAARLIVGA